MSKWRWEPYRIGNGYPTAWRSNGVRIVEVKNAGGFTNYDVKFPDGGECRQAQLHEAKQYAEAHWNPDAMCMACGEEPAEGPGSKNPHHCVACGAQQ